MEDDKKRRKNKKKKKNKQQAKSAADDTASNTSNASYQEQNHMNQTVASSSDGVGNRENLDAEDKGGFNVEATNGALSDDVEKCNWLQEEARLRDMVKQLLYEKNSHVQRQTDLEKTIEQLQSENDSWHQKEVILEQKISHLRKEQDSLSVEKKDLLEKVRHIEKETSLLVEMMNSSKEMIASLNSEKNRLHMQVAELEGVRDNLSQEKQQSMDNMLILQSKVQELERSLASTMSYVDDAQKNASEKEKLNAEIEAAFSLVKKLMYENAELVEKLNELYMELRSKSIGGGVASAVIPNHAAFQDPISASEGTPSSAAKTANHLETVPTVNEQQYYVDPDYAINMERHSLETDVSGEIVQISLDENEARTQRWDEDLEGQHYTANEKGQEEDVPLVDAPLIGAPFRLVSFVAKFVSGADLVKSSAESQ